MSDMLTEPIETYPQDIIAERSVLGGMILSSAVIDEVTDVMQSRDFYHPQHELIFETIVRMHAERQPVDAVTVADALGSDLQRIGGPTYLHQLIQQVPTAANASYYAGIVAEVGAKRRLLIAGLKIRELARTDGEAAALVEDARRAVDQVSAQSGERTLFLGETVEDALRSLESAPHFVPTPWTSINKILGGLYPGGLYVVGARPAIGKTVVGFQLALELVKHGSVAFASLEMSRNELWARFISSDLQINLGRIMERRLGQADWDQINAARERWARMPLAIRDKSGLTVTDVRRFARSTHRRHHLSGVVVDYLQLMVPPRGDKRPRHEFVADVSRQLKLLAMEMQVPVIALSQLNRASEQRMDKQPQLSDLRESGAVEQDADVVLLLHRELTEETRNDLKVLVAKNRHGRTGVVQLQFQGHYSTALEPGALQGTPNFETHLERTA